MQRTDIVVYVGFGLLDPKMFILWFICLFSVIFFPRKSNVRVTIQLQFSTNPVHKRVSVEKLHEM